MLNQLTPEVKLGRLYTCTYPLDLWKVNRFRIIMCLEKLLTNTPFVVLAVELEGLHPFVGMTKYKILTPEGNIYIIEANANSLKQATC